MACPFFMPVEKLENGEWLHASRLPLGCGWSGHCTAPGHEGENPSQNELRDYCNLGYAENCNRLPRERPWDSVRFAARSTDWATRKSGEKTILVRYICERGHLPAEHGSLIFDWSRTEWATRHSDSRIQRMAECFVSVYMQSRKRSTEVVANANLKEEA